MKPKEIIEWIGEKEEFSLKEILFEFKMKQDIAKQIIEVFMLNDYLIEPQQDNYLVLEKFKIFINKAKEELIPKIREIIKNWCINQKTKNYTMNDWEDIKVERFVIFEGSEKIYDIYIQDKIVRLEGKEILDYNIFRLRFFEVFGKMLATYKGIASDWAKMVSLWYKECGEYSKEKTEVISDIQEAKDLLLDYINTSSISDTHIVKEGMVCVSDGCIFVPTKIIKKLLKRENLKVSLRKLAYVMDEYLVSGSIPLKIYNKSERFWKFDKSLFKLDEKTKIEIIEEKEETPKEEKENLSSQIQNLISSIEDRIGKLIPLEELYSSEALKSYSKIEIDKEIEELRSHGIIFMPREGYIQKV